MSLLPLDRINGNGHGPLPEYAQPRASVVSVPAADRTAPKTPPALADPSRWLQLARGLLAATTGRPETGELRVTIRNETGDRVTYLLTGINNLRGPGGAMLGLSPLERQILEAVSDGPLPAEAIARRINHSYDSCLRVILANLCEREPPVLRSSHYGYIRTESGAAVDDIASAAGSTVHPLSPIPDGATQQPAGDRKPIQPAVHRHSVYRDAVLEILREAKDRLTAAQILNRLDRRGLPLSDRGLARILSEMMLAGELTNLHDRRGYGFPGTP